MRAFRIAAPVLLLLLTGATSLQQYSVDPEGSAVSAKVAFLGIGSKTARFPSMSGSVAIAPDRLKDLKLDVSLDARALTASDKLTTDRLRGEKFFWVSKYPTVRFRGDTLTMAGARSGSVKGQLTARGVTRPVVLNVTFDKAPASVNPDEAITLTGVTTINRRDFGMKSYSLIVGKKVTINLRARLVPN